MTEDHTFGASLDHCISSWGCLRYSRRARENFTGPIRGKAEYPKVGQIVLKIFWWATESISRLYSNLLP